MRRRLAVLLVDALGWELAGRAEGFAPSLVHRRRLDTVLGFSSGALPTLFTGRLPFEHGRFLMYRRAGSASPFQGMGWTRALPERARRSGTLTRFLTRSVERRGVRGYFNLYEVPRPLLPEFDLAERDDIFAPGGLPGDSIWDALARAGVRWRGWNWRTPESESLAELERALAEGDETLLFCYTADLDALLHHEGSSGAGVRERLRGYGAAITRLERAAAARGDELWLFLLSDHGMVDVTRTADVMSVLRPLPVGWPRDYLPFFDSTMARFWWRTPGARERVRAALAATGWGRWLADVELERAGALFPDRRYGEDLYLLDPGVLLVPSFMGRTPIAAMHGYDPSHPDMAALLWSNRPIPPEVRHLRDVRAHLEAEVSALLREAA
jgi:hypothetical protein